MLATIARSPEHADVAQRAVEVYTALVKVLVSECADQHLSHVDPNTQQARHRAAAVARAAAVTIDKQCAALEHVVKITHLLRQGEVRLSNRLRLLDDLANIRASARAESICAVRDAVSASFAYVAVLERELGAPPLAAVSVDEQRARSIAIDSAKQCMFQTGRHLQALRRRSVSTQARHLNKAPSLGARWPGMLFL